jgi:hypothetical protein
LEAKLLSGVQLTAKRLNSYVPHLDTLKNSFAFLKNISEGSNGNVIPAQINNALGKIAKLEGRFEQAAVIQRFLRERRQYLKDQLKKFGLSKHLRKLNKDVYYYSQMIRDYKEIISDPKKIEAKAITMLQKFPAFREFVSKNSFMSSLFGMSGTPEYCTYICLKKWIKSIRHTQRCRCRMGITMWWVNRTDSARRTGRSKEL